MWGFTAHFPVVVAPAGRSGGIRKVCVVREREREREREMERERERNGDIEREARESETDIEIQKTRCEKSKMPPLTLIAEWRVYWYVMDNHETSHMFYETS